MLIVQTVERPARFRRRQWRVLQDWLRLTPDVKGSTGRIRRLGRAVYPANLRYALAFSCGARSAFNKLKEKTT